MSANFFDGSEAVLLGGSDIFSTRISSDPVALGLTLTQANAYAVLQSTFASAYALAQDPATRSRATIATKNAAKEALIAEARKLARIIQAHPGVTDTQRIELGLTVRQTGHSAKPRPQTAPGIDLLDMHGHTLYARLHDSASTDRRGRPEGVAGATVLSYVGPTPPADLEAWNFVQSTVKTSLTVEFDSELAPGTKVWVTAFWFNDRQERGPVSEPVSALIQFGGLSQAA